MSIAHARPPWKRALLLPAINPPGRWPRGPQAPGSTALRSSAPRDGDEIDASAKAGWRLQGLDNRKRGGSGVGRITGCGQARIRAPGQSRERRAEARAARPQELSTPRAGGTADSPRRARPPGPPRTPTPPRCPAAAEPPAARATPLHPRSPLPAPAPLTHLPAHDARRRHVRPRVPGDDVAQPTHVSLGLTTTSGRWLGGGWGGEKKK